MSLRFVLMGLLSEQPDTGYGLKRRLRVGLSHIWEAPLQQIYSELAHLHADGCLGIDLVDQAHRLPKKVYSVTDDGRRELISWLRRPDDGPVHRDQLLMKLYLFPRVGGSEVAAALRDRLKVLDAEISQVGRRLRELKDGPSDISIGYRLSLEGALSFADAWRSWCERALEEVAAFDRVR
ncbi:MAG: PadR family transcriptional regulator [Dehalococcoidia bacterium]